MSEPQQMELDFTAPPPSAETSTPPPPAPPRMTRRDLQRAVLAWLVRQSAAAMATQVPTRTRQYKADVAACWHSTVKNPEPVGPSRVLRPTATAVVEVRRSRQDCWPDCTNSDELAGDLRRVHERLRAIQAQIRRDEPELKRGDSLFEEYAEWDYDRSANPDYAELAARARKLEKALYKGTAFEGILRAAVADRAYLAVPEGTLAPDELAHGWGLLWVRHDLDVEVRAAAHEQHSATVNRTHLAQNIAVAGSADVLFANGVCRTAADVESMFRPVPRRRRRRKRDSHG